MDIYALCIPRLSLYLYLFLILATFSLISLMIIHIFCYHYFGIFLSVPESSCESLLPSLVKVIRMNITLNVKLHKHLTFVHQFSSYTHMLSSWLRMQRSPIHPISLVSSRCESGSAANSLQSVSPVTLFLNTSLIWQRASLLFKHLWHREREWDGVKERREIRVYL